jgi:hypothetical protein
LLKQMYNYFLKVDIICPDIFANYLLMFVNA